MDRDRFLALTLQNPVSTAILHELLELELPDAWLVSGCLVQTIWNVLTGRQIGYGIADYDVFYFDPDLSWEAEDRVIRRAAEAFACLDAEIELRNQARVHLWFDRRNGTSGYPRLTVVPWEGA